jgi:hypothetical protein
MASGVVIPGSSSRELLAKDPAVYNIPVVANTENSYTFPSSIRRFLIKVRSGSKLQITFTALASNTTYFTLAPGAVYAEENLDKECTVFFQAPQADVVEILTWSKI